MEGVWMVSSLSLLHRSAPGAGLFFFICKKTLHSCTAFFAKGFYEDD